MQRRAPAPACAASPVPKAELPLKSPCKIPLPANRLLLLSCAASQGHWSCQAGEQGCSPLQAASPAPGAGNGLGGEPGSPPATATKGATWQCPSWCSSGSFSGCNGVQISNLKVLLSGPSQIQAWEPGGLAPQAALQVGGFFHHWSLRTAALAEQQHAHTEDKYRLENKLSII